MSDAEQPTANAPSHDDPSPPSSSDSTSSSSPVEFRFLIDNSAVGGLIGKGGANVKRVRDESGAFVSIMKAEARSVTERIMLIKGSVEQIGKAALLIAELLVEAAASKERPTVVAASVPSEQAQLRLLVHKLAVGAVIGKAGAVIKETQQETGARVQVSNEPLPNSSEKTVTITGIPTAVQDAITRVVTQLKDNPLKPGTRVYEYNPNAAYGGGGGGGGGGSHYAAPPSYPSSHSSPLPVSQTSAAGSTSAPGSTGIPSTQKIAIPTVCAGCVIGKNGSVIRDLRAQSGTNISISDPEPNAPNERVVTLTGSAQGIQTAVYLIRQLVEQYQPQGGQQQQQY